MMRRALRARLAGIALILGSFLCAGSAFAHKPSDSYLALEINGDRISGQWDIALRDLEYAIGLDANGDGEITWGEVRARHADIAAYALARLALRVDGRACELRPDAHLVDDHSDGAYEVLKFSAVCPPSATSPQALDIDYSLFFDFDAQHEGLLRLVADGATTTGVFSADRRTQHFALRDISASQQFLAFARQGVWHIWIGFDHILFLLSLLLPAVLVFRERRWMPVDRFRPAFWDVVRVVTSFTLAHSITLSLAALEVVTLPSRLVESTIALSVVLAALNNVRPVIEGRRWLMAFVFGLIHGFGFAGVLADLGLPRDALLLALVGFNLGVEGGQLAIVAIFLPLAFLLRETPLYRRGIMAGGSVLIAMVAAIWFIERAFAIRILTAG
jgi:hypothetical protein